MKFHIPLILIYARLFLGGVILALSFLQVTYAPAIAVTLLTIGLLTDIFDGIIARRLGVSTQRLRRLDSTIDQIFFVCVAVAAYVHCLSFGRKHFHWAFCWGWKHSLIP